MAVEIEELQEECTGITLGGTASYLARYLVLSVNNRLIQADRGWATEAVLLCMNFRCGQDLTE
jgi:hypothetical protein